MGASNSQAAQTPVTKELLRLQKGLDAVEDDGAVKGPWIKSPVSDVFFGVVIFLNSVMIGVDVELSGDPDAGPGTTVALWSIETCFLILFLGEMLLRMRADGCKGYFSDPWGPFDSVVTTVGCLDAWILTPVMGSSDALGSIAVLRVLRMLRLLRLLRVFRMFKELVMLVHVLVNTFSALIWIFMVLIFCLYVSAVLLTVSLGQRYADEDEEVAMLFGRIWDCMYWHLCIITGEGWVFICNVTMKYSAWWLLYWVVMMIILNFSMLNLIVGLISSKLMEMTAEDEESMVNYIADADEFRNVLENLFKRNDVDHSGSLSADEMQQLLTDEKTRQIFETFGINMDLDWKFLRQMMGFDDPSRNPEFEEFFQACARLCGSKSDIRSFFLQHEVHAGFVKTRDRINSLQCALQPILDSLTNASHPPPVAPAVEVVSAAPSGPPVLTMPPLCLAATLTQMGSLEQTNSRVLERLDELRRRYTYNTSKARSLNGILTPGITLPATVQASAAGTLGANGTHKKLPQENGAVAAAFGNQASGDS